jgi:hypothetical protein
LPEGVVVVPNGDAIYEYNTDDDKTFQAVGLYIPYKKNLYLDTRLLRCHKSVVHTLLHEICHWNQYVQGRLMGPAEDNFFSKSPVEKEADSFSSVWLKTAMKVYKGEYNERMSIMQKD